MASKVLDLKVQVKEKEEEREEKGRYMAHAGIAEAHTMHESAQKAKEKGLAKGQIRSIDEQWPAADFGIGKLFCIRDGKGIGGKAKEYLQTYSVSIGENRPLGSVAGSPVSDCNKLEEDAEERRYVRVKIHRMPKSTHRLVETTSTTTKPSEIHELVKLHHRDSK